MEVDFGISASAYAFSAGLFFVGYAVFEVPSNLLLHRVGNLGGFLAPNMRDYVKEAIGGRAGRRRG